MTIGNSSFIVWLFKELLKSEMTKQLKKKMLEESKILDQERWKITLSTCLYNLPNQPSWFGMSQKNQQIIYNSCCCVVFLFPICCILLYCSVSNKIFRMRKKKIANNGSMNTLMFQIRTILLNWTTIVKKNENNRTFIM